MKDASQLARGFPAVLHRDVEAVVAVLPEPRHVRTARAQRVSVAGEYVELVSRVYNDTLSADATRDLSGVQGLAAIVSSLEPWVVAYVVQLLARVSRFRGREPRVSRAH